MPVSLPSPQVDLPTIDRGADAHVQRTRFHVAEARLPRIVQAIGARVWSEDGTEYIDFDNAGGAVLLGHRDPSVIGAIRIAREAGDPNVAARYAAEVAERLGAMTPGAEAALFGADVSQAMRAALTVARRHTGRELVLACRSAVRGPAFPFGDLPALQRLLDLHDRAVAALVLAPCGVDEPPPGYLAGLRALADRHGAVLIFDETSSGFRVHEGGAQALWGVEADLAVFGENLANGLPLGALAGRRDLVETAGDRDPMSADIASLAAAKAVLAKIANEPVIATLRIGGAEIQAEVEGYLEAAGLRDGVRMQGDPAALRLAVHAGALGLGAADGDAIRFLWTNACLAHRLFTLGAVNMSYAHGDREIAVLLTACRQAVERLTLALRQTAQPHGAAPSRSPGYDPIGSAKVA